MKKIISIIKKNFKLIMRSRISALIILFGPLLIMVVVGLAFSGSGEIRINVGYVVPEVSNMTDSFVHLMNDKYNVKEYTDAKSCNEGIASGEVTLCVLFPHDFVIANNNTNEIVFTVDNSKINLFESVVDALEKSFNDKALMLTQGLTQELLDKLNDTQSSISNKTELILNLKNENKILREDTNVVSNEVGGLDLDFDYNNLKIDVLEDESDSLSDAFDTVKGVADDVIKESEDLINDLDDEIDDMNISSSDKNNLDDLLNESLTNILELKNNMNDTGEINTDDLQATISALKTTLRNVDQKFARATSARDTSVSKISNMDDKLNASLIKIMKIEETFQAIYSNIDATEVTNLESITKPITKRVDKIFTEDSQLNFYFPYLVILIIMFIGLLLASTLVVMEKTSRAHFRNFVTPTSDMTFIFGQYVTTLIIMVIQLVIVLSIFGFYFHRDVISNLATTTFILFLLITLFTWIGMIIGNIFNTEETSTLASISLGSILLFISDLIFPLERMPPLIAEIARTYNPFVLGTELLRKAMMHKRTISQSGVDLYIVLLYIIVVFVFVILSHKLMKRSYLLRWGGYVARRHLRMQKQSQEEKKLLKRYNNVPTDEYFITKDNKKLGNLVEMRNYIKALNDSEFKEYVNSEANVFADWVLDVLKNDELSIIMRKAKRKSGTMTCLQKGIKKYDKLQSKLTKKK